MLFFLTHDANLINFNKINELWIAQKRFEQIIQNSVVFHIILTNSNYCLQIKERVTKAASEGLSQIACGPIPKTTRSRSFSSQISEISHSTSLNNFNDFVQLSTHNITISAPVIPVVDQEKVVVKELLYCLIGVGGNYIVPTECNVDGTVTIKFNISDKIQASLRDILQEILSLAGYYYVVHKSVNVASSADSGLVMNAFSASLRSLINDYYVSIDGTEPIFFFKLKSSNHNLSSPWCNWNLNTVNDL